MSDYKNNMLAIEKQIAANRIEEYPRFSELMGDSRIVFVADGTDMLSNSPSAVAVISKEKNSHPGEPQLTAWIECLESGGSDAWYEVTEKIANKDNIEALTSSHP